MDKLDTLVMEVDALAGSDVHDVARHLCALADKLGVNCKCSFNRVKLVVRPGDDPVRLVEAYFREGKKGPNTIKVAFAN